MNTYFVSYFWKTFWRSGCGMATLESSHPMETVEGLMGVRDALKKDKHLLSCVILNFKKLGEASE